MADERSERKSIVVLVGRSLLKADVVTKIGEIKMETLAFKVANDFAIELGDDRHNFMAEFDRPGVSCGIKQRKKFFRVDRVFHFKNQLMLVIMADKKASVAISWRCETGNTPVVEKPMRDDSLKVEVGIAGDVKHLKFVASIGLIANNFTLRQILELGNAVSIKILVIDRE